MKDFKVEEKKNFNSSEFRSKILNERKRGMEEQQKINDNIWSDNVPDLEEEDPYEGKRIHCWVWIKSGKRDIKSNIFIEPSTGTVCSIDDCL